MIRFFIYNFNAVFKKIVFILGCFLFNLSPQVKAQGLRDSLAQKLKEDSLHIFRKTSAKLFLKAEKRFSFISREGVSLYGLMLGATYHEHHTFFGGYFILDPRNPRPLTPEDLGDKIQHFVDMRYGVIGYQYVAHKSRYWQVTTPLALGFGHYHVERKTVNGDELSPSEGRIYPTSAGLQVIFKPVRWIGISASGGYRYIAQQQDTQLSLKGFYYAFGIWLDGRYLSRHLQYSQKKRHYQHILHEQA